MDNYYQQLLNKLELNIVLPDEVHKNRVWDDYHTKDTVILRTQSAEGPKGKTTLAQQIRGAKDLAEAIDIAGVEIKSVSDVHLIRNDKPRPGPYQHKHDGSIWDPTLPKRGEMFDPEGNVHTHWPNHKALYIFGDTGTGKTQWAVHQFENPLVVSHMDKLREFNSAIHDGIVFDDMEFKHVPRTMIIHILDWDEDRQIHCRYSPAEIPAHTPKIFTSNKPFEETFAGMESNCGWDPAVRRRVLIHQVVRPTFTRPESEAAAMDDAPIDGGYWEEAVQRFAAQGQTGGQAAMEEEDDLGWLSQAGSLFGVSLSQNSEFNV